MGQDGEESGIATKAACGARDARPRSVLVADVRTVAPDDGPLWRDVRLSALADAPDAFGARLVEWEAADERRWRQRLEDVPFNVVAVSDGLPIGQASGTAADEDGRVELISMWVAPAARGTGTASALVDAVTGWARSIDAVAVRLSVRRTNGRAIRLYRRTDFVQVSDGGDEPAELTMVRSLQRADSHSCQLLRPRVAERLATGVLAQPPEGEADQRGRESGVPLVTRRA